MKTLERWGDNLFIFSARDGGEEDAGRRFLEYQAMFYNKFKRNNAPFQKKVSKVKAVNVTGILIEKQNRKLQNPPLRDI